MYGFNLDASSAFTPPGGPTSWYGDDQANPAQKQLNAACLTVIPQGPYQGYVLFWPGTSGSHSSGYERYTILQVDPLVSNPFRSNRWLKLGTGAQPIASMNLASGAWDQNGRLWVFGGKHLTISGLGKGVLAFAPDKPNSYITAQHGEWYERSANSGFMVHDRENAAVLFTGEPDPAQTDKRRMMVFGGVGRNDYESYVVDQDPTTFVPTVAFEVDAQNNRVFPGASQSVIPGYPGLDTGSRAHMQTDGRLFFCGRERQALRLLHSPPAQPLWSTPGNNNTLGQAAAVTTLTAPNFGFVFNRVIRLADTNSQVVESCDSLNFSAQSGFSSAGWQQLARAHGYSKSVQLPNGDIVVLGGTTSAIAEWYSFTTLSWRDAGTSTGMRFADFAAVLLEDGRVLVAGGAARQVDFEYFEPFYITLNLPRPAMILPQKPHTRTIQHQSLFGITMVAGGPTVQKFVLTRPFLGTVHGETEQRVIELNIPYPPALDPVTGRLNYTVRAPSNIFEAPPGWYMLWAVTAQGAPSPNAEWVRLMP